MNGVIGKTVNDKIENVVCGLCEFRTKRIGYVDFLDWDIHGERTWKSVYIMSWKDYATMKKVLWDLIKENDGETALLYEIAGRYNLKSV